MTNKKAIGRPAKVNYTVMGKLEDALQYGVSVKEACNYAGISRDTFYRYLKNEVVFLDKMKAALSLRPSPSRFTDSSPGFINQYNQKQPIHFLTMLQKYPLIFRC